jgi:hypothetical protein
MEPVYLVRPWAGGWGVFTLEEKANLTVDPLPTAADAVAHAKTLAKRLPRGAHIRVHEESGHLLSEFFYQHDERPSLERDDETPSMAASRPARRRPSRGA